MTQGGGQTRAATPQGAPTLAERCTETTQCSFFNQGLLGTKSNTLGESPQDGGESVRAVLPPGDGHQGIWRPPPGPDPDARHLPSTCVRDLIALPRTCLLV